MNIKNCMIFTTAIALLASTSARGETYTAGENQTTAVCAEGFVKLFDGETLTGWKSRKNPQQPITGWEIADGVLKIMPKKAGGGGGDIITEKVYSDFTLKLEFKLTPKANSGIKYLFDPKKFDGTTMEYQILEPGHKDAQQGKDGNRATASLYDLLPANAEKLLKPGAEWNSAKLVVKGMHVEHWLNGEKVLEFERDSEEFKAAVAESKFKKHQGWGTQREGHILLQDHNDTVFYRNIMIKE